MADIRGGRTHLQEQAAELNNSVRNLVLGCDRDHTAITFALGVRLLQIMMTQRSPDFRIIIQPWEDHAREFFSPRTNGAISEAEVTNARNKYNERAKQFEVDKHPKAANFCRVFAQLCEAILANDKGRASQPIARACVKAWYAGANINDIRAAALLLF